MNRVLRRAAVIGASLFATGTAPAEGLKLLEREASAPVWPQWQARRTVLWAPSPSLSLWSTTAAGGERPSSTLLVGDYLLTRPSFGWWPAGGQLRASTGLVLSTRAGHDLRGPDAVNHGAASLPYIGLGYAGLSPKGGWSISADLGLTADTRSLGHLFGSQRFDSAWRELRFAPVLQVGVRYSF